MPHHYLSFQYSAIQKTILRHHRLWWMAGTSLELSRLNEIRLPRLAGECDGTVLVAGGGKFTARFRAEHDAHECLDRIRKTVVTTFPMLEFQTAVAQGKDLMTAWIQGGLREALQGRKAAFRGYGVTFNPHLARCEECGEYPVVEGCKIYRPGRNAGIPVCSLCRSMFNGAKIDKTALSGEMTTLEKVYALYFKEDEAHWSAEIPANFEDLFPAGDGDDEGRRRMAVWASDINNMNDKVPVWLRQEEDRIGETFDQVKQVFVDSVVRALADTRFEPVSRGDRGKFLPFRIIVAGGDDLCIVMDERYVLDFGVNMSSAVSRAIDALPEDHPLNVAWLEQEKQRIKQEEPDRPVKETEPYGFGASFVVTPLHAPFSRLHALSEELMKEAKHVTGRNADSVNWRIIGDEADVSSERLDFEKPLFITSNASLPDWDRLTLTDYLDLCFAHAQLTNSHAQQIAAWMLAHPGDAAAVEKQMVKGASAEVVKSYADLLLDKRLRDGNDGLRLGRLATFLELFSLRKSGNDHDQE